MYACSGARRTGDCGLVNAPVDLGRVEDRFARGRAVGVQEGFEGVVRVDGNAASL